MGGLSALIVGPCVAAPLAGALVYISQTRNALLGGVALFSLAMGMSAPLLLVGLSAGTLLPRAGGWMESVKHFFGVLLLAVAIWMVTPVIPAWLVMMLWATLLLVCAVNWHAFDRLPDGATGLTRLRKGLGIAMALVGASLLVGALSGGRDPLQPLGHLGRIAQASSAEGARPAAAEHGTAFTPVRNLAELEAAVAASTQPVMLDFYADWCVSCKEMEKFTFSDPAVRARLAGMRLLQADVTANNADDKALLKRFGLFGPPGILFFAPGAGLEAKVRVIGYQDAAEFLASIKGV
jgi:thiol:disulfide interchange protein DsbD